MARILVTDGMAQEAVQVLLEAGHEVDLRKVPADELPGTIGDYDALVVRSATQVTREVIEAGVPRLKLVGRAGVGVDNVDQVAATQHGVVVMNAPLGNILSAAEHTIGMIFSVCRNIPQAHRQLSEGTWDKKSHVGVELYGKTLGVVGLGKIGKHVARVMQGAGMNVIAHDPYLSSEVARELDIEPVSIEDCLKRADILTLHVPKTDKTANLINAESLKLMKPTARLVNVARGGVVNEADLRAALDNGTIAAAAIDVFATEPMPDDNPLRNLPNAIITPHLGASTEEAQVKVSTDIAEQFNAYFEKGQIINAVNVNLRVDPAIDGYLRAAEQLAGVLVQMLEEPITALELEARGELTNYDCKPLSVAALKGALGQITDQRVNFVNAAQIAKERGITWTTSQTPGLQKRWLYNLAIIATTSSGSHIIGGRLMDDDLRVMRLDDYPIDLPVSGHLLILEYPDRPGMVGKFGSLLGQNEINIARMEVGRIDGRGDALVILTLDDPVPDEVLDAIKQAIKPSRAFAVSI